MGRTRAGSTPVVGGHLSRFTDGVFPESKEFLAGYWIVDVDTPAADRELAKGMDAYAIAAKASAAPGIKGAPLNMPIEVRQVMSGPPDDLLCICCANSRRMCSAP